MLSRFSHVRLLATPWIVAHQVLLSVGFSRQEYWSRLPFPLPGDLPNQGIESVSCFVRQVLSCRATREALGETWGAFIYFFTHHQSWTQVAEASVSTQENSTIEWLSHLMENFSHWSQHLRAPGFGPTSPFGSDLLLYFLNASSLKENFYCK